jgi:pilus assembly protein Flp/PilA
MGTLLVGQHQKRRSLTMLARLHLAIVSPRSLLRNEEGVTAIEYGLIAGLIVVGLIGALTATGTNLATKFGEVRDALAL